MVRGVAGEALPDARKLASLLPVAQVHLALELLVLVLVHLMLMQLLQMQVLQVQALHHPLGQHQQGLFPRH
jgi:hypothetical protein